MTAAQKRPSRFARNAVANWVALLFIAVVGFFLSPYVVQQLGATRYGVWSLLAGLLGYLGLLDLGVRQAVNRYVARHHATGDHGESSSIVSAAIKLFSLLGLLAILLSLALAFVAPLLFNIPPALVGDTRVILVIGGLTAAVTLMGGVFGGVVTALERFDVNCYLDILVTSARTVAIVAALREGHGLVALAAIHLGASLLNCGAFWLAAHRLYGDLRLRLRGPLSAYMRTILAFGASLSVIYLLSALTLYSDAVVIAAFLPIEAVAFFAIAGSLVGYAKEMPKSLAFLMTPRVSALTSTGRSGLADEIVAVSKFATLVAAPVAATFVVRGESFITLWMGAAYGPVSGEVLKVLAIAFWLEATRSVVIHSLTGMGKQRAVIPGLALEAAGKIALSVALVRPLGIVGVALGTLIAGLLVNLAYIPHCLSRAAGVPVRNFLRQAILLPTAACVPFALASAAIERFVPAANLAVFFAQVLLILPLVPLAAWFLCLTAAERDQIESALRRRAA